MIEIVKAFTCIQLPNWPLHLSLSSPHFHPPRRCFLKQRAHVTSMFKNHSASQPSRKTEFTKDQNTSLSLLFYLNNKSKFAFSITHASSVWLNVLNYYVLNTCFTVSKMDMPRKCIIIPILSCTWLGTPVLDVLTFQNKAYKLRNIKFLDNLDRIFFLLAFPTTLYTPYT